MEQIFVKPAPQPEGQPALKVRKLINGYLAEGGELVNAEGYWLRRIADGDVVGAAPPDEPPEAQAAKSVPRMVKTNASNL
ncbi:MULTISPECIES: DUF2635 domain-containing protein [unclassified Polaromonas]|jgi:hypothetical protein|uniref:DUF2635 domain-containing protein n=1 Tax=unclassified Polaromonas TaxID=2638319 RepID=UPI000BCFCAAE|nr:MULTISPECIES: DUF2635 domain-containing protein [unclassified Polaromonas]OYY32728.1 MAG: hypothetical protein B7Y60_21725 [Polaromonas sp. 35-63-35]OYZ15107.1 MAG: hypothetical protein B7Y28_22525 [Polaromonas sp. 16-63-31]OYZ75494.1 MAG: hypothetical protein B7Y09_23920 [Polaromonas sp. 24-63-21]OZA53003.1 MAG: hypothetical protein B7X88_03640 [Polaromonas sp. 17-63-33]OZA85463.1 MAG: hypothetical protein B7X65_21650 [Polaromonas sp. 39-63-25]